MTESEKEENANDDIVKPDGPFRDEEKAEKEEKAGKDAMLETVNNFHQVLLDNPKLWDRPEMGPTREFVYKVSHDPWHFPPKLPLPSSVGDDEASSLLEPPPLTKGFIVKVYSGAVCDNMDLDDDYVPTVVVTNVDSRYDKTELRGKSNHDKRYTLHVADGDDNILTVLIATQLNSQMGTVKPGTVMKLCTFRRGFRPRLLDTPERLAVLVTNLMLFGSMEVKESLLQMPSKRLSVEHPRKRGMKATSDDESEDLLDDEDIDVDDGSDNDDEDQQTSWRSVKCSDSNRLCSSFGYGFDVCVAEAFPIKGINLEEVAKECWFQTKEVSKMTNSEKRNVLYWWFMVNMYHIAGKGNRKRPPACLIKAIREAYPNLNGERYVDFQSSKSRKRKR